MASRIGHSTVRGKKKKIIFFLTSEVVTDLNSPNLKSIYKLL